MILKTKGISEFQSIYAQEFGDTITFAEAEAYAKNLLNLFTVILRNENG